MTKLASTKRPKWLEEIAGESERIQVELLEENKNQNDITEARIALASIKLQTEESIEALNEKFGVEFIFEDLFGITTDEEQQAIDIIEGEDDDE